MGEYKSVEQLLSEPARWTKGASARNQQDESTGVESADACKFCLYGAVSKVYPFYGYSSAMRKLHEALGGGNDDIKIAKWNDAPDRTHAEVLEVVRKAGI